MQETYLKMFITLVQRMLFSTGTDGVDDSLFKSMNYEIYVEYFLMVTVFTPPGQLLPP